MLGDLEIHLLGFSHVPLLPLAPAGLAGNGKSYQNSLRMVRPAESGMAPQSATLRGLQTLQSLSRVRQVSGRCAD